MDLHKETKTTRFDNIYQQSIVNVMFTYNWCNDKLKRIIYPFDITAQQFNILRILRGQFPSPSTVNLLKDRMLDKMCDASRIVDRLVQKDLVIKSINRYDKRSVDITINERGLSLLKKMDEELNMAAIISRNLNEEEAKQLNVLLDKLRG